MTVKDIKERILHLENCKHNMDILTKCIVHNKQFGEDNHIKNAVNEIEDEAGLNVSLDILCSNVAQCIEKEIKRLENIINNTVINEE